MLEYSILIPVFNKAQLTQNCLQSLAATTDPQRGEIIVIDNGSTDETAQTVAQFAGVRVIRNDSNLGFAAANNQGARAARGRFLVLLNNDTQALEGWMAAMLAAAQAPHVGVVGARLLFPDGRLQHGGVVAMPSLFGPSAFTMVHDLYGARGDDPRALQSRECQAVTGACMLTPRELYSRLGGLDECYANGLEDVRLLLACTQGRSARFVRGAFRIAPFRIELRRCALAPQRSQCGPCSGTLERRGCVRS